MALKLFCTACQKFIKEVTPQEAKDLADEVICKDCENVHRDLLDKLNAEYKKISSNLSKLHNDSVVRLENIIRKVYGR